MAVEDTVEIVVSGAVEGEVVEITVQETVLLSEEGGGGSMTAGQILTALKTVDGTGSGLDADLLDGHDTAYFATDAGLTTEAAARAAADTAEAAARVAADATEASARANADATLLVKNANLSDLPSPGTARTNLELGSMAVQNANAVTITGGNLTGVDVGGSFLGTITSGTTFEDPENSRLALNIVESLGGNGAADFARYPIFASDGSLAGTGIRVLSDPTAGIRFIAGPDDALYDLFLPTPEGGDSVAYQSYVIAGLGTEAAARAAADALLAPLASPALTGNPTAPTQAAGNNTTRLANTAFVTAAIVQAKADIAGGAPGALDTLDELAAALGDDANFAATVTNSLAGKLSKDDNLSDLSDLTEAKVNLGLDEVENQALSTWVGSTALTTLGTITTGTWHGGVIDVTYGGTGRSSHSAFRLIAGGTTSSAAQQSLPAGTANEIMTSSGAGVLPAWSGLSALIDAVIGSTRGGVLYRGASGWALRAPNTAGYVWTDGGAGADPNWAAAGGGTGANPSASVGLTAVNGAAVTFMRSDGAPALSQAIVPTWTGAHVFLNTAVGTSTATPAVTVSNTTAATSGNQKNSPTYRFISQGFRTGSGGASQTITTDIGVRPVQGSANASAILGISFDIAGGGFSDALTLTPGGLLATATNGLVNSTYFGGTSTTAVGGIVLLKNNSNNANAGLAVSSATTIGFCPGTVDGINLDTETDAKFTRKGAGNIRQGAADAASPVAQTSSVQGVSTGTSNTAGANWTFAGSQGTGTGAGGSILFKTAPAGTSGTAQNALVTCLTLAADSTATFASAVTAGGPVVLPSYTVATVPSAATFARGHIYVSDETGGATGAFSDGTNWRRYSDRAIVS